VDETDAPEEGQEPRCGEVAKMLDAVLPPLPENEWMRLKDLAIGKVPFVLKERRRRVGTKDEVPQRLTPSDLEKLAHVGNEDGEKHYLDPFLPTSRDTSTSKHDKILALSGGTGYWQPQDTWLASQPAVDEAFEDVLEDELLIHTLNKRLPGRERGHRVTGRLMRHLWTQIWKQCPLLVPEDDAGAGKKWKVVWGKGDNIFDAYRDEGGEALDELFGVGETQETAKTRPWKIASVE